ncbi:MULTISPECIES: inositol monophosphatase family protein [unclassified Corynebacterium]|uniref:inositol monophosphatase family protein n=1 Tax=unclassified Corynebacterium TaxID=2624378 RepID=UPI0029CA4867|nr:MULTISPECIES: inositol monophosphatase family protein [unclassified Corynebacterium]WPF65390.1 inositol monophosphatase family protein [Corynebacterium sp. 22KM0430]WPF67885.1 inositol monophosphatase family protein [Corynebacterium sp. 21KM1197]
MDTQELLAIAQAVVDEAEALFVRGVGTRERHEKAPGEYVTDVDVRIEEYARTMLIQLTGIPVYGEERGGSLGAEPVWVIDPIDGTANYAVGNPLCSILLSLLVDRRPVLAVSSLPLLGRRLTAVEGGGLMINGAPVARLAAQDKGADNGADKDSSKDIAQVGFSSLSSQTRCEYSTEARHRLLADLSRTHLRPRVTGSVGVDLSFAAQGIFAGAISFSPHAWDNAAGALLVGEAGGVVTDTEGQPWTPDSSGLVVGDHVTHALLLSTMRTALSSGAPCAAEQHEEQYVEYHEEQHAGQQHPKETAER